MNQIDLNSSCPCGSGQNFGDCCQPIISGKSTAPTAENLMRARYSAYVFTDIPFLKESLAPDQRSDFDENSVKQWSKSAEWKGLEVLETRDGGKSDDEGEVYFAAHYVIEGQKHVHRERAKFEKSEGQWFFKDGEIDKVDPIVRDAPKIGRNDPCSCGSGKKFKKCCG